MKKEYSFTTSNEFWEEAQKYIANGTQGTRQPIYDMYPTYFEKAKGCRMWDVDGNEFIDLLCSIGPVILGYSYDRVDRAVKEIIDSSFQSSTNHPVQIKLAKLLTETIPSAEKVRFLKTGTDATVAAVRLARHVTNRTYIARCGYHGWADMWRNGEQGGTHKAAWEVVLPFDGTAESLDELFRQSGKEFAAVILCPADTKPFTKENYQSIVDVAHKHGALVIFDEVKTGFRIAVGGAQELLGVTPDLTILSKGLGNGYPIATVVGKDEYMMKWNGTPTSGTFFVEALSITAANETVREIKEKNVVSHLWDMGQRLIDGLNKICDKYGIDEAKAYPDPVPSMPRFTWHPGDGNTMTNPMHQYFFRECIKKGLFFCPWHVAFVNFSHKKKDIDEALEICDEAMRNTIKIKGTDLEKKWLIV